MGRKQKTGVLAAVFDAGVTRGGPEEGQGGLNDGNRLHRCAVQVKEWHKCRVRLPTCSA